MEQKRLVARVMLQRAVNLTKQVHEIQQAANTSGQSWSTTLHVRTNSNSDAHQLSNLNVLSNIPQLPTYALGPQRKFDFKRAQKALQLELNRICARIPKVFQYEPQQCISLIREISHHLRRVMKHDSFNTNRYRLVVLTTIVQMAPDRHIHQSATFASRCLWDRDTDGSVTVQAPLGSDMIVVAVAYAVYKD